MNTAQRGRASALFRQQANDVRAGFFRTEFPRVDLTSTKAQITRKRIDLVADVPQHLRVLAPCLVFQLRCAQGHESVPVLVQLTVPAHM